MKVAIIHYWLVTMRGGEKVLEEICRLYPDADIYTHVLDRDALSPQLQKMNIQTSFIADMPFSKRLYQKYLPLMPMALEQLDLTGYDLILSSESGPAKGIIPPPGVLHICYCHSPMRYIWNMYHEYRRNAGFLTRMVMPFLSHYMRLWDSQTALRVDHFVCNAANVAKRVQRYYKRNADVIHPPVDLEAFQLSREDRGFYLFVGQLVGYKRANLAVEACNRLGRYLLVVGEGEQMKELLKIAGPTIKFVGSASLEELKGYYQTCSALLFPGEEDFGIVPLEAMACGKPVIALAKGGACETVIDGVTGILYQGEDTAAVQSAIETFESKRSTFDGRTIRRHAEKFAPTKFRENFSAYISKALAEHQTGCSD